MRTTKEPKEPIPSAAGAISLHESHEAAEAAAFPLDLDLFDRLRVVEIAETVISRRIAWLEGRAPARPADVPRVLGDLTSLATENLQLALQRAVLEREIAIATGTCPATEAPN